MSSALVQFQSHVASSAKGQEPQNTHSLKFDERNKKEERGGKKKGKEERNVWKCWEFWLVFHVLCGVWFKRVSNTV